MVSTLLKLTQALEFKIFHPKILIQNILINFAMANLLIELVVCDLSLVLLMQHEKWV